MVSPNNQFDDNFLEILKQQKSIVSFLDSVFGFLYRCTDFYQLHDESSSVGFPSGVATEVVKKMYFRYEQQTRADEKALLLRNVVTSEVDIPAAEEEVVVGSTISVPDTSKKSKPESSSNPGDHYNGDDRGTYRWSQTLQDIDLLVIMPPDILKSKQLSINIEPTKLKVEANNKLLLEKLFPYKVSKTESLWSLIPGNYVQINLEKNEDRWWDRLFTDDPPINVQALDTTVNTSELSQEDHMKIQELVVGQDRRQNIAAVPNVLEKSMEQAWKVEGSPFQELPIEDLKNIEYIT